MATIVRAKKDESNDSVIKRFRKKVVIDQILPIVRSRAFHIKPSQKRKIERKERERRIKRERRIARNMGY